MSSTSSQRRAGSDPIMTLNAAATCVPISKPPPGWRRSTRGRILPSLSTGFDLPCFHVPDARICDQIGRERAHVDGRDHDLRDNVGALTLEEQRGLEDVLLHSREPEWQYRLSDLLKAGTHGVGAAAWGFGSRSGHYASAQHGRMMCLGGAIGAFVAGAAVAFVNFGFGVGGTVH